VPAEPGSLLTNGVPTEALDFLSAMENAAPFSSPLPLSNLKSSVAQFAPETRIHK
jgi:hypothetical protein